MTVDEMNEEFAAAVLAAVQEALPQYGELWGRRGVNVEDISLVGFVLRFGYRDERPERCLGGTFEWAIEERARRPDGRLRLPEDVAFDAWTDFQFELFAPPQGRHCCRKMAYYLEDEDDIVYFWERFDEYLIPVHDGGSSGIVMRFCPWCGTELPASRRETVLDEEGPEDLEPMTDEDWLHDEEDEAGPPVGPGELEGYTPTGRHLGAFEVDQGARTKPGVSGRTVEP